VSYYNLDAAYYLVLNAECLIYYWVIGCSVSKILYYRMLDAACHLMLDAACITYYLVLDAACPTYHLMLMQCVQVTIWCWMQRVQSLSFASVGCRVPKHRAMICWGGSMCNLYLPKGVMVNQLMRLLHCIIQHRTKCQPDYSH